MKRATRCQEPGCSLPAVHPLYIHFDFKSCHFPRIFGFTITPFQGGIQPVPAAWVTSEACPSVSHRCHAIFHGRFSPSLDDIQVIPDLVLDHATLAGSLVSAMVAASGQIGSNSAPRPQAGPCPGTVLSWLPAPSGRPLPLHWGRLCCWLWRQAQNVEREVCAGLLFPGRGVCLAQYD